MSKTNVLRDWAKHGRRPMPCSEERPPTGCTVAYGFSDVKRGGTTGETHRINIQPAVLRDVLGDKSSITGLAMLARRIFCKGLPADWTSPK